MIKRTRVPNKEAELIFHPMHLDATTIKKKLAYFPTEQNYFVGLRFQGYRIFDGLNLSI